MATTTKKALVWLLLAFVAYTIVVSPAQGSGHGQSAFASISTAGESLGSFFDALVS